MANALGDAGPGMIAGVWVFVVVTWIATAARLYTRKLLLKFIALEDWIAIVSCLLMTVCGAMLTAAGVWGLGRRTSSLRPEDTETIIKGAKYGFIALNIAIFPAIGSKLVVIVFLLRLVIERWQICVLWFCLLTYVPLSIGAWAANQFRCMPIAATWDPRIEAKCNTYYDPISKAGAIYSIVLDFALALLPWCFLWNMNMKRKDRIMTIGGLSLGIFAGLAGIARVCFVFELSLNDALYLTGKITITCFAEAALTLVCATIPILRPLWMKLRGIQREREFALTYATKNQGSSSPFTTRRQRRSTPGGLESDEFGLKDDPQYESPTKVSEQDGATKIQAEGVTTIAVDGEDHDDRLDLYHIQKRDLERSAV